MLARDSLIPRNFRSRTERDERLGLGRVPRSRRAERRQYRTEYRKQGTAKRPLPTRVPSRGKRAAGYRRRAEFLSAFRG